MDSLCSMWWIITINAKSEAPICFVMTLDEVKSLAHQGTNKDGKRSYWLQATSYDQPQFRENWERLGAP